MPIHSAWSTGSKRMQPFTISVVHIEMWEDLGEGRELNPPSTNHIQECFFLNTLVANREVPASSLVLVQWEAQKKNSFCQNSHTHTCTPVVSLLSCIVSFVPLLSFDVCHITPRCFSHILFFPSSILPPTFSPTKLHLHLPFQFFFFFPSLSPSFVCSY